MWLWSAIEIDIGKIQSQCAIPKFMGKIISMHIQNVTDISIARHSCKEHIHIATTIAKWRGKEEKWLAVASKCREICENRFSLTHFTRNTTCTDRVDNLLEVNVILMQSGVYYQTNPIRMWKKHPNSYFDIANKDRLVGEQYDQQTTKTVEMK